MDFTTMTTRQLEERREQIRTLIDDPDQDLDALENEIREINAELESREEKRRREEMRRAVAAGAGTRGQTVSPERAQNRTVDEIRNSAEYIDTYAECVKRNNFDECRALLTTTGGGTVAIPDLVHEIIKTAWDKEGIMRRVTRIPVNGNLEVGFEYGSSDAVDHTEGQTENEGSMTLGIATIAPRLILKWVSLSKEVMKMRGEAFLRYAYSALVYKIAQKAAKNLIAKIEACDTVSTATMPGVPKIVSTTVTMGLVASAIANLSDEASAPVIMMNKLTWSEFKAVQYANGYGANPFEGLEVEFNSNIKPFAAATTGETFLIVGDLGQGALSVSPEGETAEIQADENTLATSGLIRLIGSEMVGVGVVAPNAFVKVTK